MLHLTLKKTEHQGEKMQRVHLLVIDPQQDFCNPDGALFVPGADKDMERLSKFVRDNKDKLYDIHCTLDSHRLVDVAHPIFWKDQDGNHPKPFTTITKQDVENHKWTTSQPGYYRKALNYVTKLAENDRYPLMVWPPHCLIGHWGSLVVPELFSAFQEWEQEFAVVDYVTKGSNILTEHYSALQADVPDPTDPQTQLNTQLIQTLEDADLVVIAGEAGSHCLANSVRDIANNVSSDEFVRKLVLLEDATSPVTGCEQLQDDFINEMVKRGMQISTTDKFLQ
jgi:nicotinamidase-related amidase